MPNKVLPTQNGKIIKNSVSMYLDNRVAFSGWENMRIQKAIGAIANSFSFTYSDKFKSRNDPWPIKPGQRVEINVDDERVITGFIETLDTSFSASDRTISVSGRSLPGDLVDCSVTPPYEYTNIKLDELAKKLIAPFGLKVFLSVEPGIIEKFAVKPGETIFTALDRAARLQGFFWVSTREGNIRLTRAGRARAFSELKQDVNMLAAGIKFDNSKRFRNYKVIGQSFGTDNFFGSNVSAPEGTAVDNGVSRDRSLTVVAEGNIDSEKATVRAGWEASSRIAEAMNATVSVVGWRQENGILWGINQIVRVKSDFLGLNQDMLISEIEHIKDNSSGTVTNISLVRKDSYESKPDFKKEDDPIGALGPIFQRGS